MTQRSPEGTRARVQVQCSARALELPFPGSVSIDGDCSDDSTKSTNGKRITWSDSGRECDFLEDFSNKI